MIKNYFKSAWRNIRKNKFYSVINISGLALGLAVGIMILLWVQNETSYDGFHSKAGSIFKINSHIGTGASAQVWSGSPAPLTVFCKQSIPEVIDGVRISSRDPSIFVSRDKKFAEQRTAFADASFFAIFDFKMIKGDAANPFHDNNSIVINASTAKKYFNTEDAIGKTLMADNQNFIVTGVMKDFPKNSTLKYDIIFPMSLLAKNFTGNGAWKTIDEDLGDYQYDIYLLLQNNVSPETVAKKITKLFLAKKGESASHDFFALQSFKTLHLIGADGNTSALQAVKIFLIIGILILIIACINYVNLSTARSMVRAKEVSVRKIIGAGKHQLFIQFIAESALLFLFASVLAFLIIYLLLPLYNDISGEQLAFDISNPAIWLVTGLTIAGSLFLSGIYPALLLSSFKPVLALKGKLSFGAGNSSFRKVLVVTQFVFSVFLIIGTIVITKQLLYIKDKDLGFDRSEVFSFALDKAAHSHFDAIRDELLKQPGIVGVASANNGVIGDQGETGDTYWDGKESGSTFLIHPNGIDKNVIPVLRMRMAAGINFTGSPSDSAHLILNETAVRLAGIKNPIGKSFTLWRRKATIIGVVKDFNYASLKQSIEPVAFYYDEKCWGLYIKTTTRDASRALSATQKIWKKYSGENPFQYSFLDDDFNKLYTSDEKMGILISVFAAIAILISCLGLFGLVTFTAQVKTKEIGIRKVLGAGVITITTLLAKEFIILVLISFIIAAPVAWFALNKWLETFAYRTSMSWWIFGVTAGSSILIALMTVGFRSVKAALANPVKSLRTE